MATIGTFTAHADGSFTGAINTLTINLKNVQLRPAEKSNDKSPDLRAYAGKAELGAAWKKTSKDEKTYHSVKLDDPSFAAPINAALVDIESVQSPLWACRSGSREN